jgi:hypothetical protein
VIQTSCRNRQGEITKISDKPCSEESLKKDQKARQERPKNTKAKKDKYRREGKKDQEEINPVPNRG